MRPFRTLTDLDSESGSTGEARQPEVRLHDLRHSFASFAAAQGASLLMIGNLLGYTQIRTTQRYANLVADPLRAVAEIVGVNIDAKLCDSSSGDC
jgi:site-specific recombinase XerD